MGRIMMNRILKKIQYLLTNYPAIFAAILIYGYYLFTTLSLFQRSERSELGFADFILQYDSLIFLWVIAYLFIKTQQMAKKYQDQKQAEATILTEAEKSRIASNVLNGIIKQLQDRVNNPLTIIASHSDYIRGQLNDDNADIIKKLDHIDNSLHRVHTAIQDDAAYTLDSILSELQAKIKKN